MAKATASAPPAFVEKPIMVYPSQLLERKANNRFNFGNMVELRNSINAHGVKQPLRVRKTSLTTTDGFPVYEVAVGNRRARACKEIGANLAEESAFVPVIVLPKGVTDVDVIIESIATDAHGLGRSQIEIAYDVNALNNEGWKGKDIAQAINKSAQYVSDCLKFMQEANDDLIKQVKTGQVPFTTALDMIKSGQAGAAVAETVEKIIEGKKKAAAKGGEEIINPDKKANVVNKVKKSELQEASGIPKKVSKSAPETSVKAAGSDAPKAPKVDESLLKLKQLHTAISENKGSRRIAFKDCLEHLIEYIDGTKSALDIMPFFFWGFDEELDGMYKEHALKNSKNPVKIANVILPPTQAQAADLDSLDDLDDIDAPPAKPTKVEKKAPAPTPPTKGAKTLKEQAKSKGKRKPVDDDEEGFEAEELPEADFDEELE